MPRIAYLFERFPSFGQTFCYREVAELRRQGMEFDVFSIRRPENEPAEEWDTKIIRAVTYLPEEKLLLKEVERLKRARALPEKALRAMEGWGRRTDFLRLYQAAFVGAHLREIGIKHVHAHFAGMAARTAWWIKQFFGIEFSFTAHANDIFAPREFEIGLTTLFEDAKFVVTVSDFAVAQLQKKFPQTVGKIHRVYNGIDVEQFTPANFANEIALILSVGRLIEKKGFAHLIAACQRLRKSGRKFRCEIIGEGPLEASLRALIEAGPDAAATRRAGEADQELDGLKPSSSSVTSVQLVGAKTQREIIQRLASANVFVLPCVVTSSGEMDNLPTVIMEAMAAGLPVISTTIAGIPEMIQSGINGTLVAPGNVEQLVDAIDAILSNPIRTRQFGERSRGLAAEKFSLVKNVAVLRQFF